MQKACTGGVNTWKGTTGRSAMYKITESGTNMKQESNGRLAKEQDIFVLLLKLRIRFSTRRVSCGNLHDLYEIQSKEPQSILIKIVWRLIDCHVVGDSWSISKSLTLSAGRIKILEFPKGLATRSTRCLADKLPSGSEKYAFCSTNDLLMPKLAMSPIATQRFY